MIHPKGRARQNRRVELVVPSEFGATLSQMNEE
jgi:hypothetical protein